MTNLMWDTKAASFHRFPNPGWAWPQNRLDKLIFAAIATDRNAALKEFRVWLDQTDIDDVEFREHRLLAAITERFGNDLADLPEYPRLVGLQRMLWTKSRMAIAETKPILRQFSDQKIPMMLLKGAARLALNPENQKSRISHDLDILIPPSHFGQALKILALNKWQSSSGESHLRIDARKDSLRAMNFFSGRFGDIDLHQWAFGVSEPIEEAEKLLWENAQPANYFGIDLLVPAASERTSLAICHSGLDAHNHSDWMVDCAHYVQEPDFDWDRLAATIKTAEISVPAEVTFSYLQSRIGVKIPEDFISKFIDHHRNKFWRRATEALQTKPRTDWTFTVKTARGIAKMLRLRKHRKAEPSVITVQGKIIEKCDHSDLTDKIISHLVDVSAGDFRFELDIEMQLSVPARRIELELNTDKRHLARLQLRLLRRKKGRFKLRYSGNVRIEDGDTNLWLEARPGRYIYANAPAKMVERYQEIPFHIVNFRLVPKKGDGKTV